MEQPTGSKGEGEAEGGDGGGEGGEGGGRAGGGDTGGGGDGEGGAVNHALKASMLPAQPFRKR